MHHFHHLIGAMRPVIASTLGCAFLTTSPFAPATVTITLPFSQRFAYRIQRLFNCAVDEAAGVHHHQITSLIADGDEGTARRARVSIRSDRRRLGAAE